MDPTLKDIFDKLNGIEMSIREIRLRELMGKKIMSIIPMLEQHAQTCDNFDGYTMLPPGTKTDDDFIDDTEPTIHVQCSCGKDYGHLIIYAREYKRPIIQECIDEINKKYKKSSIPKPEIKNPTDRMIP